MNFVTRSNNVSFVKKKNKKKTGTEIKQLKSYQNTNSLLLSYTPFTQRLSMF